MYDLSAYGSMCCDFSRVLYDKALEKLIVPGETRVLDIGAGTGFLSLLALKHGAAKVYACDTEREAIDFIPLLLAENQINSERVKLFESSSRGLNLYDLDGEKVDIIVSDIHGCLPHNSILRSLYDAKRLLKDGGHIVPQRDVIRLAPVEDYVQWKNLEFPWRKEGVREIFQNSLKGRVLSRFYKYTASLDNLLASAQTVKEISYQASSNDDTIAGSLIFPVARLGTLHGFVAWFDAEISEDLWVRNEPGGMNSYLYHHLFFPLQDPILVRPGFNISLNFSLDISDDLPGRSGMVAKCIKSGIVSDEEGSPIAVFSQETN